MSASRGVALAVAVIAVASSAVADGNDPVDRIETSSQEASADDCGNQRDVPSDFWRGVKNPAFERARTLLRHGVHDLLQAIRDHRRARFVTQAHAENAIVKLRLAHARLPDEPEPLYLLAYTRGRFRGAGAPTSLTPADEEARELFERLRRLDPDYQAARVAHHLAVIASRGQELERASREYARARDSLLMEQRGPPQWRSEGDRRAAGIFGSPRASGIDYNHAEVIMAQGRLEEAAELYERAVAEAERSHDPYQLSTQILARWGLAAAQDRLGHHALALETAKKAIRLDEMPMSLLHADGVFFIPSYERHYYEGLGYMALATMRQDGVERLEAYEQAAKRWRTFLERGGAASPWASVARMHLRRVREALAGLPPRR